MSQPRMAAAALLALGLAACSDQPSAPSASQEPVLQPLAIRQAAEEVVPGEILVQMKDGASTDVLTGGATGLRLERRLTARSRVSAPTWAWPASRARART